MSNILDWIDTAKQYEPLIKTGVAALSTYASYKDQKKKNEMQQAAYDDYMKQAAAGAQEAAAAIDINYTPMTVSGVPTTKADVTDFTAVAAKGGLMSIPNKQRKRYYAGTDEEEVLEMDEEVLSPFDLQQETGIDFTGEQVRAPSSANPREGAWNVWNSGGINQEIYEFDFEIFFESGDWMDMLKGEAPVQENMQMASDYSDDDLQGYEQYKYDMNEQMPGQPIIEIDEWLRMEHGAATAGVKNGGIIGLRHGGRPGYSIGELVEDKETLLKTPNKEVIENTDTAYLTGEGTWGIDRALRIWTILPDDVQGQYGNDFQNFFESTDWHGVNMKKGGIAGLRNGGRVKRDNGGIMNLGGLEKDYRTTGGFVPIGGRERADDVPARLSKNEFVMTADAVRAAGGGSINKGAQLMYDTMKNLEARPQAKRMTA